MSEQREELTQLLRSHYRGSGWNVAEEDGRLEAVGPHGVKWIGRAVTDEDLRSETFEAEIVDLADSRMPEGNELRPLDLLPADDAREGLEELLKRTGLAGCTHISVYSIAA